LSPSFRLSIVTVVHVLSLPKNFSCLALVPLVREPLVNFLSLVVVPPHTPGSLFSNACWPHLTKIGQLEPLQNLAALCSWVAVDTETILPLGVLTFTGLEGKKKFRSISLQAAISQSLLVSTMPQLVESFKGGIIVYFCTAKVAGIPVYFSRPWGTNVGVFRRSAYKS